MKLGPRPWTSEETQRLLQLKEANTPKWEIAKQLNRTRSAIDGKLDSIEIFGTPDDLHRHSVRRSTDETVSNDLLRERDRLAQMDNRTPAQIFLGEPPIFRSALFKKTGQTA